MPLTPFVGRDLELAEIAHLLETPECRLLTVTGTGGVGKTRLALQAAQELSGSYSDGAYFVPLDAATGTQEVPGSIASALDVELRGQEENLPQLIRALKNKHLLLVLDNYEQLLEGATLTLELLQACSGLKLLVTSRERLNLAEEWLLPLKGFAYPDKDLPLEEAQAYDAVQFFLERARRVQSGFNLSDETLPDVLEICRLVDGLPLGLELAAVWVRVMPLAELAREIKQNLDFLSSASRNLPERQQSIRAAFEHSWKLLTPKEQEVLRKLSVFRGGFRREAAAYVAGASLVILAALVDKSLLRVSGGRYHRHPLLYQFTQEKLAEHPEEEARTRDRHLGYFLSLAEEAEPQLREARQTVWLTRLEAEHDNLHSALQWAEAGGQLELGLRLASALPWFWQLRGHMGEGYAWLARLLQRASSLTPFVHAAALRSAGEMAHMQGRYDEALSLYERSLEIAQDLGDKQGVAKTLVSLAVNADRQGDLAASRSRNEKALIIWRELDDEKGIARCLHNLAMIAGWEGDYATAYLHFKKSLAKTRELNDTWGISRSLFGWGVIAHRQRDYGLARSLYDESLSLAREIESKSDVGYLLWRLGLLARDEGDNATARSLLEESLALMRDVAFKYGIAHALCGLGLVACNQGDYRSAHSLHYESLEIRAELGTKEDITESFEAIAALKVSEAEFEQAACLWGAAEVLHEVMAVPLPPNDRLGYDKDVAAARDKLGETRFKAAWAKGRAMNLEEATAYALEAVKHP